MTNLLNHIDTAFSTLPPPLRQTLQQYGQPPYSFLPATVTLACCQALNTDKSGLGLALLPLAAAFAEAPISNFYVGAVAFDACDNTYLGANFEFTENPIAQTLHAEQSAIAHAWSRGAAELTQLVINYPPCGHCRQFINEVKCSDNFTITLPNTTPQALKNYLPNPFGPGDLGITQRILGQANETASEGISLAQEACHASHAPYSQTKSGIAVQFSDGEWVAGRYGENAAFNPSLPPLPMALNYRRLQGKDWQNITAAIMVEQPGKLSQKSNTVHLLQTLNKAAELHYKILN